MQTATGSAKSAAKKAMKVVKKAKATAKNVKTDGKLKTTLSSIQSLLESQPDLKAGLKEVVDTEKRIYDAGSKQVGDLAKYLKANWKVVVPALAALGIGAHFLGHSPKAKKLVK